MGDDKEDLQATQAENDSDGERIDSPDAALDSPILDSPIYDPADPANYEEIELDEAELLREDEAAGDGMEGAEQRHDGDVTMTPPRDQRVVPRDPNLLDRGEPPVQIPMDTDRRLTAIEEEVKRIRQRDEEMRNRVEEAIRLITVFGGIATEHMRGGQREQPVAEGGESGEGKGEKNKVQDQINEQVDAHKKESTPVEQGTPRICDFCGAIHRSSRCTVYTNCASRIARSKELGICIVCANKHKGRCPERTTCVRCGHSKQGPFHAHTLCPRRFKGTEEDEKAIAEADEQANGRALKRSNAQSRAKGGAPSGRPQRDQGRRVSSYATGNRRLESRRDYNRNQDYHGRHYQSRSRSRSSRNRSRRSRSRSNNRKSSRSSRSRSHSRDRKNSRRHDNKK